MNIFIEKYETQNGVYILRDDLLPGGTKSILIDSIIVDAEKKHSNYINEIVYASPCYGGFQIALSIFCKNNNKKATIFCAKRKQRHPNTELCIQNGANVIEVPYGYLSVVEKHARDYITSNNSSFVPFKISFGANSLESIAIIASRANRVIELFCKMYGKPPDEIWCAVGSGTLINGISRAVSMGTYRQGVKGDNISPIKIYGVQVGKEFKDSLPPNVTIIVYPKPFEHASKLKVDFPSMKNYDLKAFELCLEHNKMNTCQEKKILFWNVL
jgi:hypothetical protein